MTKLFKALLAGLTLIGVLSLSSLAVATQSDDDANSGDKFYLKGSGGVAPQ